MVLATGAATALRPDCQRDLVSRRHVTNDKKSEKPQFTRSSTVAWTGVHEARDDGGYRVMPVFENPLTNTKHCRDCSAKLRLVPAS